MHPAAQFVLRLAARAVALSCVQASLATEVAGQSAPERSGPWAFTRSSASGVYGAADMATTPAAEDSDVWFLVVCDRARLTVSLMHGTGFPYDLAARSRLILRFAGHPQVEASALPISDKQLSIVDAVAPRLMPLISGSERVVMSVDDRAGGTHDYTFLLQPSGSALAGINRDCREE
jgi:hypothetical protein